MPNVDLYKYPVPLADRDELYPDDILGELCDRLVGDGLTFIRNSDDEWQSSPDHYQRPSDEYNRSHISTMTDYKGRTFECITPFVFGHFSRTTSAFSKLLGVVQPRDAVLLRNYLQPNTLIPRGIKINALPQVRQMVESALTQVPDGETAYPRDAFLLSPSEKAALLQFLEVVMEKPKPRVKAALAGKETRPIDTPTPQLPSPAPQVPRTVTLPVASRPSKQTPPNELNDTQRRHWLSASYGFATFAGTVLGFSQTLAYNVPDMNERIVISTGGVIEAGLFGFLALVAYRESKNQ